MTLSRIYFRNIKYNLRNYICYLFSLIFSIFIYFIFSSLQYNAQIEQVTQTSKKMSGIFQVSSSILALFVAVFIIYSNVFFTDKRKKEIGIYSILGIQKQQIVKMLFYENLIIGALALGVGIIAGSLCSKLFLELLINLMNLDMQIDFELSISAIINTSIIFFLTILYVSIQNYRLIYRFKLIEWFQTEKEIGSIPKGSVMMTVVSFFLIGSSYFVALMFFKITQYINFQYINFFGVTFYIVFGKVIGTYFLFKYMLVFILWKVRNNKTTFYNGMTRVTVSQLLYRTKEKVKLLATISILSTVMLSVVGISITMYHDTVKKIKDIAPYSYSYEKKDSKLGNKINTILNAEQQNHSITKQFDIEMIPVFGIFEGEKADRIINLHYRKTKQYQLVSQSTFNHFARKINVEPLHLYDKEAFVFDGMYKKGNGLSSVYTGNKAVFPFGKNKTITVNIKGASAINITNLGELIVIIPDTIFQQEKHKFKTRIVRNINVKDEKHSEILTEKLLQIMPTPVNDISPFKSFYTLYKNESARTGMMVFVGVFLGFVFMLVTGLIIYLKQITEANVDYNQYFILQKIGRTRQEIKQTIAKQVRFAFIMPLLISSLHSLVVLKGLSIVFSYEIVISILISFFAYSFIYIGYYFLTVHSYYKIINNQVFSIQ
ncbi:ABC transporter permease [Bacillus cereus]|uniref:ABC transporter permease n=1 Tax=Bacillus cereus TaxID=1396 RepID=A0A9X7CGZ3_BACCE|nr:ABC transporter permease [Bacillus cereus]PGS63648.1 ABC transporter permease [Bacillus cereus]